MATLVGCACFCAVYLTLAPASEKSPAPQQTHLIHIDGAEPFAPAFVAAGSAHERGVAYGKQYRNAIHEFLDQEVYKPFIDHPAFKGGNAAIRKGLCKSRQRSLPNGRIRMRRYGRRGRHLVR